MPGRRQARSGVDVVFEQLGEASGLFTLLLSDDAAAVLLEPAPHPPRNGRPPVRPVFRQGIEQGLFRRFDPRQLAEMFFAAMIEPWKWPSPLGDTPKSGIWTRR